MVEKIPMTAAGHLVLENDLKWSNWEDPAQQARTWQALDWLRDSPG